MPANSLTVSVPQTLLTRIRDRAKQAKHSLEAEVVILLRDAVSADEQLPVEIELALAEIPRLDDRDLQKALKPTITKKQSERLAALTFKAQDKGLTTPERREQEELLRVADKSMLVRAAVLAELHKRGVDVSQYVAP
jgi:plasmid stability protein